MKRIISSLLLAFAFAACGDATAPQSGVWSATTGTGFSFNFTVSLGADEITRVEYIFSGLTCGGVTHSSGSVSVAQTPGWAITDRVFAIRPTDWPHINGTFHDNGAEASGSWAWSGCGDGAWTASR